MSSWLARAGAPSIGNTGAVRLIDRNGRVAVFDVEVEGGGPPSCHLTAPVCKLGNSGNVVLQDDQGNLVDSVTYAAQDAGQVDRFIRFRR